MERTRYRLRLDLNDPAAAVTIHAKRCDSGRSILATLLSGGAVYPVSDDLSAVFTARKPDGKVLYNACTIEAGRIRYDLTPQTTAAAGLMECELRLFRGEQLITSPRFHLMVEDTVYDENAEIESTSEFTTLTGLGGRIEEMLRNGDFKGAPFTYEDFTPEQLEDLRASLYGYYIPSVSGAGDLTWQPTSPVMPQVDGGNIAGPTPRLTIGTVTTLAPGSAAGAAIDGTAQEPILHLSIPAGEPLSESAEHPGCFYRTVSGQLQWLNPPMEEDTEYATLERWQGKTVYTRLINCGVPAHGKNVTTGLSPAWTVVRKADVLGLSPLPFIYTSLENSFTAWTALTDSKVVTCFTGNGYSTTSTLRVQLWYVK